MPFEEALLRRSQDFVVGYSSSRTKELDAVWMQHRFYADAALVTRDGHSQQNMKDERNKVSAAAAAM